MVFVFMIRYRPQKNERIKEHEMTLVCLVMKIQDRFLIVRLDVSELECTQSYHNAAITSVDMNEGVPLNLNYYYISTVCVENPFIYF